jgi:molybdenum cofactor guanylyltransferase
MSQARVAGLVLAGGNSSRMIVNEEQTDKAWVIWQGKPLIQHVVERLRNQVDFLIVNASLNAKNRRLYEGLALQLLSDIETKLSGELSAIDNAQSSSLKQGPLAGVLAGLIHCQATGTADWLQVVPCDAPSLPNKLVEHLLGESGRRTLRDSSLPIFVPVTANRQEQPMFALLPVSITNELRDYFNAGGRSLLAFARSKAHKENYIFFEESVENNFANINSLADFEQFR